MRVSALVVGLVLVASGCALRPRYGDFITADTKASEVRFAVIDTDTKARVAGAKVEVGEFKSRVVATTDKDGVFTVPVSSTLISDNPVFVVALPKGVTSYRIEPVKDEAPAAAPAPVEQPVEAPAPTEAPVDVTDAGVPASN